MNAPPALVTRPTSPIAPIPADEELGLAELLDLFTSEDPAAAPTARRSLRADRLRLRAWAQGWLHRATSWGAGPGGAWRAW